MQTPNIKDYMGKHIHMIGIGGSSMSGLAEMLLLKGYKISGSDNNSSVNINKLRDLGADITIGHFAKNVEGADLVVYTAAILPDNIERVQLKKLGIPNIERAVLLGQLMEGFKKAICVCGTHGKTTTTGMIAQVFYECNTDPTIHIGGVVDVIGGSTRAGKSDLFIAEACEFKESFLQMHPSIAVIMNIEEDHLDYYKDIEDIERSFLKFLNLLPKDGLAIGCGDDKRVVSLLEKIPQRSVSFGTSSSNDWQAANIHFDNMGCAEFDVVFKGEKKANLKLSVPGKVQVTDAIGCIACAVETGLDLDDTIKSLSNFIGVHRRFELTGEYDGVEVYHDYGHNPAEMAQVLETAAMRKHNRLWAVMQPHTYSRVKRLFKQYIPCTHAADITLVTDIYAAREKDPGDIHAMDIVNAMKEQNTNVEYTASFDDTEKYLTEHWQPGDVVVTLGCGDINKLNIQIEEHLNGDKA